MTVLPSPGRQSCCRWLALAGITLVGSVFGKPIVPAGIGNVPVAASAVSPVDSAAVRSLTAPQFETVPMPLPANVDSVGFEATGTSEFGDLVRLQGDAHFVGTVAITLSSSASHALYPGSSPWGFTHPITLTLYSVDRTGPNPRPDAVLVRLTDSFLIPWRTEASAKSLLPGRAFTIGFDLAALGVALPDEVIFGVSFNTEHFGAAPIGQPGPYNFLGMGVTDQPAGVGVDVEPNSVFWRSISAGHAAASGSELRADSGWLPYKPAVRFTTSPYGALYDLSLRLDAWRGPNAGPSSAVNLAATLTELALDRELWDGNAQLQPILGRYAFDLLAEAADELTDVARAPGPIAADAQAAIDTILATASTLAQSAVADAIIFGGNVRRVLRAQTAIDNASDEEAAAQLGQAVDHYGTAWQEAQAALQ